MANEDVVLLLQIVERLMEQAIRQSKGFGNCPFCAYSWNEHENDCPSQKIWEIQQKYKERD